jgi:hypothetical protein
MFDHINRNCLAGGKKKLDDSSRVDVVEIARGAGPAYL